MESSEVTPAEAATVIGHLRRFKQLQNGTELLLITGAGKKADSLLFTVVSRHPRPQEYFPPAHYFAFLQFDMRKQVSGAGQAEPVTADFVQ